MAISSSRVPNEDGEPIVGEMQTRIHYVPMDEFDLRVRLAGDIFSVFTAGLEIVTSTVFNKLSWRISTFGGFLDQRSVCRYAIHRTFGHA